MCETVRRQVFIQKVVNGRQECIARLGEATESSGDNWKASQPREPQHDRINVSSCAFGRRLQLMKDLLVAFAQDKVACKLIAEVFNRLRDDIPSS